MVEALLVACPRLRLDGAAFEDDVLALFDGLVAKAEHDSADDGRDDQQAGLVGLGVGGSGRVRVRVRVRGRGSGSGRIRPSRSTASPVTGEGRGGGKGVYA